MSEERDRRSTRRDSRERDSRSSRDHHRRDSRERDSSRRHHRDDSRDGKGDSRGDSRERSNGRSHGEESRRNDRRNHGQDRSRELPDLAAGLDDGDAHVNGHSGAHNMPPPTERTPHDGKFRDAVFTAAPVGEDRSGGHYGPRTEAL
eukprot:4273-Heterococcus_DN1.PRE.1